MTDAPTIDARVHAIESSRDRCVPRQMSCGRRACATTARHDVALIRAPDRDRDRQYERPRRSALDPSFAMTDDGERALDEVARWQHVQMQRGDRAIAPDHAIALVHATVEEITVRLPGHEVSRRG